MLAGSVMFAQFARWKKEVCDVTEGLGRRWFPVAKHVDASIRAVRCENQEFLGGHYSLVTVSWYIENDYSQNDQTSLTARGIITGYGL